MAWDHAFKMQTSHNLFMVSFNSKYIIYIVKTEAIIVREGEGVLLSRLQNIAETAPPVRNKKNKKPIILIHCEQQAILRFAAIRSAVHCLYN